MRVAVCGWGAVRGEVHESAGRGSGARARRAAIGGRGRRVGVGRGRVGVGRGRGRGHRRLDFEMLELDCAHELARPELYRFVGFAGSYSMKTCSMPMMSVFRKA